MREKEKERREGGREGGREKKGEKDMREIEAGEGGQDRGGGGCICVSVLSDTDMSGDGRRG